MRVVAEPVIRPLPRTISQLLAMRDNRSFGKMGNEFWVMATAVVILALIMLGVWCPSLVSLTGTRR